MKTLNQSFHYVRSFTIVIVLGCFSLCCLVLYRSYRLAALTQSKIYILVNGKALEALAADRRENIAVEARDHIILFHQYFFNLDPDDKSIKASLTKALYLADASAERPFLNLREKGYYSDLVSGNIIQRLAIDSIAINTSVYPYTFYLTAHETMRRATSILHRSLVTEGSLISIDRSDNNTHGFLIERWRILENNDLTTENR